MERGTAPRKRALDVAFDAHIGNAHAKLIFIVMARRANASHLCFMAFKRIADEAECNIKTVRKAVDLLLRQGWLVELESKSINGRRPRRFRVETDEGLTELPS